MGGTGRRTTGGAGVPKDSGSAEKAAPAGSGAAAVADAPMVASEGGSAAAAADVPMAAATAAGGTAVATTGATAVAALQALPLPGARARGDGGAARTGAVLNAAANLLASQASEGSSEEVVEGGSDVVPGGNGAVAVSAVPAAAGDVRGAADSSVQAAGGGADEPEADGPDEAEGYPVEPVEFPVDATHDANLARVQVLVGQDVAALVQRLWPEADGGLGGGLGACVLWVLYALSATSGGGGVRVRTLERMSWPITPPGSTGEFPVVFSTLSTMHPWYGAASEQAFAQLVTFAAEDEFLGCAPPSPALGFSVFKDLMACIGTKSDTVGLSILSAGLPHEVGSAPRVVTATMEAGGSSPMKDAAQALSQLAQVLTAAHGAGGGGGSSNPSDKLSPGVMASSLQKYERTIFLRLSLSDVASPTPSKAVLTALQNASGPTLSMAPAAQPWNLNPWHVEKGVVYKERTGTTIYGATGISKEDDYLANFDADCSKEQMVSQFELYFRTVHVLAMSLPEPSKWITQVHWSRVVSLLRASKLSGTVILNFFRPLFVSAVEEVNSTVGSGSAVTFDTAFAGCADRLENSLILITSTFAAVSTGTVGGVSSAPTPVKGGDAMVVENEKLKRQLEQTGRQVANLQKKQRGGGRGGGGGGRGGGGGGRGGGRGGGPPPGAGAGGFSRAPRPDEQGKKKGGLDSSQFGDCTRPHCGKDSWCNRSHAKKPDFVPEQNR